MTSKHWAGAALLIAACLASGDAGAASEKEQLDVKKLFATTCGFCHSNGGRTKGRGPKLMDSKRSDDYIVNRIKKGRKGKMPAFRRNFSDEQIQAMLAYIRDLKPQ